jgi:hypothetical protein
MKQLLASNNFHRFKEHFITDVYAGKLAYGVILKKSVEDWIKLKKFKAI